MMRFWNFHMIGLDSALAVRLVGYSMGAQHTFGAPSCYVPFYVLQTSWSSFHAAQQVIAGNVGGERFDFCDWNAPMSNCLPA
jgi:hypothetical protein